jgi:hypothetical protein
MDSNNDGGLKRLGSDNKGEFWAQQRGLVAEMRDKTGKFVREGQKEKYQRRLLALVGDTAYFGFFLFCGTAAVVLTFVNW